MLDLVKFEEEKGAPGRHGGWEGVSFEAQQWGPQGQLGGSLRTATAERPRAARVMGFQNLATSQFASWGG